MVNAAIVLLVLVLAAAAGFAATMRRSPPRCAHCHSPLAGRQVYVGREIGFRFCSEACAESHDEAQAW